MSLKLNQSNRRVTFNPDDGMLEFKESGMIVAEVEAEGLEDPRFTNLRVRWTHGHGTDEELIQALE